MPFAPELCLTQSPAVPSSTPGPTETQQKLVSCLLRGVLIKMGDKWSARRETATQYPTTCWALVLTPPMDNSEPSGVHLPTAKGTPQAWLGLRAKATFHRGRTWFLGPTRHWAGIWEGVSRKVGSTEKLRQEKTLSRAGTKAHESSHPACKDQGTPEEAPWPRGRASGSPCIGILVVQFPGFWVSSTGCNVPGVLCLICEDVTLGETTLEKTR